MNFRFLFRIDRNLGEFKYDENVNIVAENELIIDLQVIKEESVRNFHKF